MGAIHSDDTIMTMRRANTRFSHHKEETHATRRRAKPKHAPGFVLVFFFKPSSNSAQNKLAAYFVHTSCNLGIACAILHRHTCDNTLQSAPSALICKAGTCCCRRRRRMCMLFSSSLTACPCGFFFPSSLFFTSLPPFPPSLQHSDAHQNCTR